jgi:hypothetical protein
MNLVVELRFSEIVKELALFVERLLGRREKSVFEVRIF